uniref:Uncharacterized protein n=1 Tax=viral metagenome TaxID=1070528 RepID=A0A6M3LFM5_9ZZZZ
MDKQVEEELYQARKCVDIAMSHIHRASNMDIGFDLSKPLNILYKELDTHRILLGIYLKEIDENNVMTREFDVAEPQSWKAYRNLNTEVRGIEL